MVFTFASAYAANQIGINVIVGAFLAGAVLPARQGLFREMSRRLADVTAVILLPIFLAFSGLNTDFTKLPGEPHPRHPAVPPGRHRRQVGRLRGLRQDGRACPGTTATCSACS